MKSKIILIGIIVALIGAFIHFDLVQYLSLEFLKSKQADLQSFYDENTALTLGAYFVIYVLCAALSLPGAAVLTLAGGALFGFVAGTIMVSLASTVGATCSFLVARLVLRDTIQQKFGDKLAKINAGIEKEGAFYLFTLRLVPIFPFFVINLVAGVTPLRTMQFFFVSQIGMLPGTMVYVNAGTQLAKIDSLQGILSPAVLGSFVLLGVFPIVAKKVIDVIQKKRSPA